MKAPIGNLRGLISKGIVGPWLCEACGNYSQFADIGRNVNRIFCKNERCRYTRIIDKHHMRIIEDDSTVWAFDHAGNKTRIRMPGNID